MKPTNISSAIGRMPQAAAPTAAPTYADSDSGVSSSRSPCLAYRPLVTPSTPPQASRSPSPPAPPTMSSPIMITEGSRAISWSIASLMACFMLILRAMVWSPRGSVIHVDIGQQVGLRGLRRALGLEHRALDQAQHLVVDGLQLGRAEHAGRGDGGGKLLQAVVVAADVVEFAGPPPLRARAMISPAASCTAKKSVPSTVTPGRPKPAARST